MTATIRWEDLPPKPWAPEVEPPTEQVAEWLSSLTHAHLVWVLDQQNATWSQESHCFRENHPGYIRHLEGLVCELQERLSAARRENVMRSRGERV